LHERNVLKPTILTFYSVPSLSSLFNVVKSVATTELAREVQTKLKEVNSGLQMMSHKDSDKLSTPLKVPL